jgi:hypothetical protein
MTLHLHLKQLNQQAHSRLLSADRAEQVVQLRLVPHHAKARSPSYPAGIRCPRRDALNLGFKQAEYHHDTGKSLVKDGRQFGARLPDLGIMLL